MGAAPPICTLPTRTPTDFLRDVIAGYSTPMNSKNSKLVYSTGIGALCPNCRRPLGECVCPKGVPGTRTPSGVRVGRETQGRAGKGVSTVTGLALPPAQIEALAAQLKRRCGSGGTVRAGVIEIQGDHRDTIVAELLSRGIQAKRSGG
jgi:translation initiation factor 1